ncbi:hypothetical protein CDAR_497691 [Caerostris darwini]|uniref:Uncharacterized protein n=1 Tax=Caerostris darwini TaxID=1538125 RepID=A0AAV4PQA5_9ARAC|nr:hypothetical protein CDAR_497691 [Caerostris darwini]
MKYRIDSFNLLSKSFQSDPFTQKNIRPGVTEPEKNENKEIKKKADFSRALTTRRQMRIPPQQIPLWEANERDINKGGAKQIGAHSFLLSECRDR